MTATSRCSPGDLGVGLGVDWEEGWAEEGLAAATLSVHSVAQGSKIPSDGILKRITACHVADSPEGWAEGLVGVGLAANWAPF